MGNMTISKVRSHHRIISLEPMVIALVVFIAGATRGVDFEHVVIDENIGGRTAIGDIDGDGFNDIVVHTWSSDRGKQNDGKIGWYKYPNWRRYSIVDSGHIFGDGVDPDSPWTEEVGLILPSSYGVNCWVSNRCPKSPGQWPYECDNYWRTPNVKNASTIPVFMGCLWIGGFPRHTDQPPEYDGQWQTSGLSGMEQMMRFCMNRHGGYVNGFFMDFSARPIGLKELWRLRWHRKFDTNGYWTTSGRIAPADWPEWMEHFKDY